MKKTAFAAVAMALGLSALPAHAEEPAHKAPAREEARIPFVDHGAIRNWGSPTRTRSICRTAIATGTKRR